eukprot:TRINITY_DN2406_c0_g1_i2.p1 TRINITY_DN2406_c0_g1~~TRINITY_DN2406_c0_g1_i2.p1  ORF type:complete len:585 (-),score=219.65 TRINITY_DN2406_c0_g1_i2:148-1725(-)
MSDSNSRGSFSALSANFSTNYTVSFTAGPTSGFTQISDGVSAQSVTVEVEYLPDNSSNIQCSASMSIFSSVVCRFNPRVRGATVFTHSWRLTPMVVSALGNATGSLSAPSTPFGTQFQMTFLSGSISGSVQIVDGVANPTTIYITSTVDSTSFMVCPAEVSVGTSIVCSLYPRLGGKSVYNFPNVFPLQDQRGLGAFTSTTPSFSNNYTVVYTAGTVSGPTILSIGNSAPTLSLQVWDTPDLTSIFTCGTVLLRVGQTTNCTFVPRRAGQVVYTMARFLSFGDSASGGRFSQVLPTFGNVLYLNFTAGAVTGPISLYSTHATPFSLNIFDVPDNTSSLYCPPSMITNSTTLCIFTPRALGRLIWTQSAFLNLSYSGPDGSFSSLGPAFANNITFFFSVGTTTGLYTVSSGIQGLSTNIQVYALPDATSTTVCPSSLQLGTSIECTITPRLASAPIYTFASQFTLSVAGVLGSFGSLTPLFGNSFRVNYTVGSETGISTLLNGVSSSVDVQVWANPDSTTTLSCLN